MSYIENSKIWLEKADAQTRDELEALDDNELKERFYAPLSFGTAGLRGVIGAGLNRMNKYVVRHTTQALSNLILSRGLADRGVVVGYDSRHQSDSFAFEACRVLTANSIKVYMFDELRPTAEVSFAILSLGAAAGINITASHNPREYNGYKLYWQDGIQISPAEAEEISHERDKTDIFDGVLLADEKKTKRNITLLKKDFDDSFISEIEKLSVNRAAIEAERDLAIVYSPLFGAGYRIVPETLKQAGFQNIVTVAKQSIPNGDFPDIRTPNPEYSENLALAIETAKKHGSELVIGTDADADRIGIAVRTDSGEYETISGNRTGAILLEYILSAKKAQNQLPKNAAAVKTIVTTELTARICEHYGVELSNVLTGFKYIGEKIDEFKKSGKTYVFGYEESYGYLLGDYARDKDSVSAALLICEAAAYYKTKGKTLYDALLALFEKYGYHAENTSEFYMQGIDGNEKMKATMQAFRTTSPKQLGGLKVCEMKDYLTGADGLPKSNVLAFTLEDKTKVLVRPSGTEPKIKVYTLACGTDESSVNKKIVDIGDDMKKNFN